MGYDESVTKILWQFALFSAADHVIVKFDIEHWTTQLHDFWREIAKASCIATLKMNSGFNCFLEGRRFIKLLFEWILRNAMDGINR